jgi:hypothetical protein
VTVVSQSSAAQQLTQRVRLQQFPLVGAHALTGHNTQGRTLPDGVVITSFTAQPPPPPQWTYVALSRVKSIDGVHLLSAMTDADLKRCCLGEEFLQHEDWLRAKDAATAATFSLV